MYGDSSVQLGECRQRRTFLYGAADTSTNVAHQRPTCPLAARRAPYKAYTP